VRRCQVPRCDAVQAAAMNAPQHVEHSMQYCCESFHLLRHSDRMLLGRQLFGYRLLVSLQAV